MTVRNFEFLFRPRSVALIGASIKPQSVGLVTAQNLANGGFTGPIWFVNPKYKSIEGRQCYPSIATLPSVPDLAVLVTPPDSVPQLISELGALGTRAAVVITAGIRGELKQAMLEASRPHTLRIQGPNCVGLMLPRIGLNAGFSLQPLPGDIAFVSQSGALITGIIDWAHGRGIGFSHVVSLGDMADVDFGDLLDHLAADGSCRAILLYMESVSSAAKFMSAARRAARSKPVVVVKAGRSASGAQAALSHTGALAGADSAYDAAFRRAGLLRVRELDDLFRAAETLARLPNFRGDRLAILTNGGGAGVLAADRLGDLNGQLATLSSATRAALDAILPPTWSHGNPIDIIGDADATRYGAALEVLLGADEVDAVVVMNCPTALASGTLIAEKVASVIDGMQLTKKPVLTTWLGDATSRAARSLFAERNIASFDTPAESIDGFMQIVNYRRAQEQLMRIPPAQPDDFQFHSDKASSIIQSAIASKRNLLSEAEGKSLLAAYGIPVVPTAIAKDPDEVRRFAQTIIAEHGACAIKILSDDISHKSDVGGVRLDLKDAEDAVKAASDMLAHIGQLMPGAKIEGFTVQPMIRRPGAHELILGMSVDPTFGPVMMFGAGGTAVEVLRDTAHGLPPLDINLANDMIQGTRVWRLLQGYRNRPAADIASIADALVRLSYLVSRHPEIREIDINPLLADSAGVIALDARVKVIDDATEPRVAMSIRPYPSHWQVEMDCGIIGPVVIRPIRPEDEPLYTSFFAAVTSEDRRLRFFGARSNFSHGFLARLTQIDYAREMAFVATSKASGKLVGVARLVADPDYRRAEFAILIRSDLKGQGLGWRLMKQLIAYAKAEGLGELHGSVLAGNSTMLQMCRELGFNVEGGTGDRGVHHVVLKIR